MHLASLLAIDFGLSSVGAWFQKNWLPVVQTVGIVGGLIYSGRNFRLSAEARRIANILEITKSHRDIWGRAISAQDLTRVLEKRHDPPLDAQPVDYKERTFVTLVVLHVRSQFEAGLLFAPGAERETRKDIREFLQLPIPAAVWKEIAPFQSEAFRAQIKLILD